ncbi:MAG: NmrA family NAD(P)-binding protein [Bacteroidales bacterium]|nr:NmrA family NAD(P)-binding protein [Bacteroidales bacterium]
MEQKRILITGAAGNIGYELIRGLAEIKTPHQIVAGNHNIEKAKQKLSGFDNLTFRYLDFTRKKTFEGALKGIDVVFLLRPPHLANISKIFAPFIEEMKKAGIQKIVFLSVQGVENQKIIPHHKMEKLIQEKDLEYAFLRPGYFMQNITTTLLPEIKHENKIFIPAGKLKFNWIDARDIGSVGAHILNDFEQHKNRSYEMTGTEFCGFEKVAEELSVQLGREIIYESPNLLKFYRAKRRQGISKNMIFVMIMLHYLPRFSNNAARLTNTVQEITGQDPHRLKEFISREKIKFST